MYEIIKNVIELKGYKLEDMLYKINKMYIESAITEQNKTELDRLARENAKAENSYASEQDQINSLFEQIAELKARVDILEEKPEEVEKYPEFIPPSNSLDCYKTGDKVTYKDKKYICKMDNCVWSPETYPSAWEEVIENTEEKGGNLMEEKIVKFFDNINCFVGAILTALTTVFGWQWILFASYLILNVTDWITGWAKAKYKNEESSKKGLKGIIKKSSYWILIAVSFLFSYLIMKIGTIININLGFVMLFGWFTLACMLINEFRSIIENLVELDVKVPPFLKRGLEVTQDLIDKTIDKIIPEDNKNKEE